MAFAQKAPGLVAWGISCALFGQAVYISVDRAASCRNNVPEYSIPAPDPEKTLLFSCTFMIIYACVLFAGWAFTLTIGLLSVSRNKPGLGVASGLAGVGVFAIANALQYWWVVVFPPDPLPWDWNNVLYVFYGISWAAIAVAMALGAVMEIGNQNGAVTRKAPWTVVGALGFCFMQKAAETWHLAAHDGLCQSGVATPTRPANGGYCFGFVLSGLSSFLSFVILVGVSAVSMSTMAQKPPIQCVDGQGATHLRYPSAAVA